jgi:hypothetical protein
MNIAFSATYIVIGIFIFTLFAIIYWNDYKVIGITSIFILSPLLIYYGLCSYWTLQTISFSSDGIYVYAYGRNIRRILWTNITDISAYTIRMIRIILTEKESTKSISIDLRKEITIEIKKYAPEHIKRAIEKAINNHL